MVPAKTKICIFATPGGQAWQGGVEYYSTLIAALGSLPEERRKSIELGLLYNLEVEGAWVEGISQYLDKKYVVTKDVKPLTNLKRIIYFVDRKLHNKPPRYYLFFKDERYARFLETNGIDFAFPFCSDRKYNPKCNYTSWIFDLQHKVLPDHFSPDEIKLRDYFMLNSAKYSNNIVFSSNCAVSDFNRFYPHLSVKSKVISFHTKPELAWYKRNPTESQSKYNLPDRFFLISNQFWKHKNHRIVWDALAILKKKSVTPFIVCTGLLHEPRDIAYTSSMLQELSRLGIYSQVRIVGFLPKQEQMDLLRRCIAVIQPSLSEGWSTIVENARIFGKRVLLSKIPVHVEQMFEGCISFDPGSKEELATTMERVWLDPECKPGPNLDVEEKSRHKAERAFADFADAWASLILKRGA